MQSGIGLAAAKTFAAKGMKVFLADIHPEHLRTAGEQVEAVIAENAVHGGEVETMVVDVSKLEDVVRMKEKVIELWGEVAILMNNASPSLPLHPHTIVFTNSRDPAYLGCKVRIRSYILIGKVARTAGARMEQCPRCEFTRSRAWLCGIRSDHGITTPPGNAVYNVSKSAVKTLTEQLAHELRNTPGSKCTAHLFIPGWVHTGDRARSGQPKPPGAWTPEQTVLYMLDKLAQGQFYILCPDNDVSTELDKLRINWALGDILEDRPALSRWHPEYKARFDEYIKNNMGLKARSRSRGRVGGMTEL
ncbi:hypothetical protein QFC24_000265 [Naganishia onofrii]|uniref:Uncharacterized protein n=1 Tax=Naganishia onofrii TaxID=1851511 RepID=A0ACC2XX53_9TREE|nr:hypothetical protein QFC24_000265 [Naganishia onofrii]